MIKTFDKLSHIEKDLLVQKGQYQILTDKEGELTKESDSIKQKLKNMDICVNFLSDATKKFREQTIKGMQENTSVLLSAVMDEDIAIQLEYKQKGRNDTSDKAELLMVKQKKNEKIVTGLIDEIGGGPTDIISVILRFSAIKWVGYRGPVILDESCSEVSDDDKLERTVTIFKELGENQIILSTHDNQFLGIADKHFEVSIDDDGVSKVEEVVC